MKRYLGSAFTAFAAVVGPLLCCGAIALGVIAISSEISAATIFLAFLCLACALIWGYYIFKARNQLYSWGTFEKDGVHVVTLFSSPYTIAYDACRGCGIGSYTHGILNSHMGTRVYFIYLSHDELQEKFCNNINLWKPSEKGIKIRFTEEIYDYLIASLPSKQLQMLRRDYEKTIK